MNYATLIRSGRGAAGNGKPVAVVIQGLILAAAIPWPTPTTLGLGVA